MKEKNIWLTGSILCLILYLLTEKIEIMIWMGVSLIMFRLVVIDEQIERIKKD